MGFTLQGLAPPDQRYPSRGLVSPVVSPLHPQAGGAAATPEVSSGREGAPQPPRKREGIETLPSWVFAPPRLSPASPRTGFPIHAPHALPAGNAPYGIFPDGASGVRAQRKRLVSLKTACLPGVLHLPGPRASMAFPHPGPMALPRRSGQQVPAPLRDGCQPAGAPRATASVR